MSSALPPQKLTPLALGDAEYATVKVPLICISSLAKARLGVRTPVIAVSVIRHTRLKSRVLVENIFRSIVHILPERDF
jgi:hypothetical protein